MAQIINTNISSLNAQRNLNSTQNSLATSLERLSSGLRINSAKDDAAGLAISERFTTQIRGLNQAVRNANDGISFAQTAEGALGTIGDALQRIRELSVQAANDSNSASDRQALNNEVQQLIAEVARVANSTEFNGQKVLDGSLSDLFFQVGANQGQTIAVSGVDAKTSILGMREALGSGEVTGSTLTSQDLIRRFEFASVTDIGIDFTPALAAPIAVDLSDVSSFEDIVREVNQEIQLRATLGDDDAGIIQNSSLSASLYVNNLGETTVVVNSSFNSEPFEVTGGLITFDDPDDSTVNLFATGVNGAQVSLEEVDVTTREGAFQTIAAADGALRQISSLRAELGAVQARFESTIANLSISSENLSASRSRIMDADFAAETANLTRAQILQQAGTAMLAQANALPQNVLNLLG
ncbi:MAG: flagellin [Methylophaga sp.]|nr:flagellin [Methylophaga sp.]